VTEARSLHWEKISNGDLLKLAEGSGFDLIVTTDKVPTEPVWEKNLHRGSWQLGLVIGAATP
jgi:hypothetical protein